MAWTSLGSWKFVLDMGSECTHRNCLNEAVLMGTHNLDFRVFLGDQKNFQGTLKRVLLSALRVNH